MPAHAMFEGQVTLSWDDQGNMQLSKGDTLVAESTVADAIVEFKEAHILMEDEAILDADADQDALRGS